MKLSDAARTIGVTRQSLADGIHRGTVKARRIATNITYQGFVWDVPTEEVERLRARREAK